MRNAALIVAGVCLSLCAAASADAMSPWREISFSQHHNFFLQGANPDFPAGDILLGGVPFSIPTTPPNIWHSQYDTGSNPRSISIDVGLFGASKVHTLINTYWGSANTALVQLNFHGSAGGQHAVYTVDLVGNHDIRDFNQGTYTNQINGTTTIQVFYDPTGSYGTPDRLDKQEIALPASFHTMTLDRIDMLDWGLQGTQRAWLAGLTVELVPEPASLSLLAAAGLVPILSKIRRRRR